MIATRMATPLSLNHLVQRADTCCARKTSESVRVSARRIYNLPLYIKDGGGARCKSLGGATVWPSGCPLQWWKCWA